MAHGSPVIPSTRGHPNYSTPSVPTLLRSGQIPTATTTRWKKKKRILGISSSVLTLPTPIDKAPTSDIDGQRCCRSSNPRRKNNNQVSCQRVRTYRSCRKDRNNDNIAGQRSGYYKTTERKAFPSVLLGAVPLPCQTGSVASNGEIARCAVDVSSELSNSPPTNAITQKRRPCTSARMEATGSPEHDATGSRYSKGSDVRPTANKNRAIVEKNATLAPTVAYETFTRPGKIWHCPTASSLREEVVADLGSVSNQRRLWRNLRPFEAGNAARNELEISKSIFKAYKKSMGDEGRLLATMQAEITEDVMERWMRRTARMRSGRFTLAQKRELRKWFDSLDKDGSGEIDSSELSNPLLSTGLARSAVEIDEMVQDVDRDGSGEICSQEFLAVFQRHQGKIAPSSSSVVQPHTRVQGNAIEKLVTLQGVKDAHGSDMETVVAFERRSVLMREIIDEANYREAVLEDLANRRYLAKRDGDLDALKVMDTLEARLEARRVENNRYIQAVSNATNFDEERQKVNKSLESGHREPQLDRSISSSKITLACIHDGGEKDLTPRSEESETFQRDEEPHHPHE